MHLSKWLLVKHDGQIKKGMVVKIYKEDLDIKLEDGTIISRKFWEIRNIPINYEKKE